MAWLVRGAGFEIRLRTMRWFFWRLVLRVRAVLDLREEGVLGLEREGIFENSGNGIGLGGGDTGE